MVELDFLAQKYETKEFIKDDPVQFPHRFKGERDVEIAGFVASLFAYGNRLAFIKKLDELFDIMDNRPLEYVLKGDFKGLEGFNYRFAKDVDVVEVFKILNCLYKDGGGLKELFEYGWGIKNDVYTMFEVVCEYFYSRASSEVGQGFYHLIPNPKNEGTMKRMNMFLRWMVRDGEVDLGIWKFMSKSELLIPVDVHVARLSREMGLLRRRSNDKKAVLELSKKLRELDSNDPVKYDFAIFGKGVNSD